MKISGFKKTSLVDFPGKIASTIFLGGCNLKCPFCHNPELVFNNGQSLEKTEIINHLKKRKNLIDGICITGGEPTIHEDLPEFLKELKEMNFLIKLDTNGTNPKMLKTLINNQLVDYVAMDIKSSFDKYQEAVGTTTDLKKIKESINFLKNSDIKSEFRTTAVPRFMDHQDFEKICMNLAGAHTFSLQQFDNKSNLLDNSLNEETPYSEKELLEFKKRAEKYFPVSNLKNI